MGNKVQENGTLKTILSWCCSSDERCCTSLAVDMESVVVAFKHALASAEHLSLSQKDKLLPEPVPGFIYATCG